VQRLLRFGGHLLARNTGHLVRDGGRSVPKLHSGRLDMQQWRLHRLGGGLGSHIGVELGLAVGIELGLRLGTTFLPERGALHLRRHDDLLPDRRHVRMRAVGRQLRIGV
jgi:hypothetical protein